MTLVRFKKFSGKLASDPLLTLRLLELLDLLFVALAWIIGAKQDSMPVAHHSAWLTVLIARKLHLLSCMLRDKFKLDTEL